MEEKVWYKSKTMLLGIVTGIVGALCVAIPKLKPVNDFLASNVATIGIVWGVLTSILRVISKDKIVLTE